MKLKQAENLLTVDINCLSLEQLQRHRVKLTDAWRESRAEYGMMHAIVNGFYIPIASESITGYTPKNIWLTHCLEYALQEVEAREKELLS